MSLNGTRDHGKKSRVTVMPETGKEDPGEARGKGENVELGGIPWGEKTKRMSGGEEGGWGVWKKKTAGFKSSERPGST